MIGRLSSALRTRPSTKDWLDLAAAAAVFALVSVLLAAPSGLAHWAPRSSGDITLLAVRALFVPALAEELVFRGALVPSKGESGRPLVWIGLSTALFGLWHGVQTLFLPGAADIFLRLDFLTLALVLGLLCAALRYRSGSLWTAVALHCVVVVAWQGWFGGPAFGGGL